MDFLKPFLPIGMAAFILASLLVGARLLLMARRTRQLPELAIGLAFFLAGGLGYVCNFLSSQKADALGDAAGWVGALGLLSINVGVGGLWIFTWRVFHRESVAARTVVYVALAALAASFVGHYASNGLGPRSFEGGWFWLGFPVRSLGFGWTGFEALRYYGLMRRRARLGLADAQVTHRILMWGLGASAIFVSFSVTGVSLVLGSGPFSLLPSTVLSVLGLTTAVLIWRAFFPRRSGATSADSLAES